MKKTTKFLLVLAAVVAMTIGAVSTVMAADVVIASWDGNEDDGYTATDADGNKIMRGWAKSADSGRWYYFVNGKMATNRFVRTNNKTYFVDANGAMATSWVEFNKDYAVNYNGASYSNVAGAFAADAKIGASDIAAFTDKTQYKTVWCYFGEDGVLVEDAWVQTPDGIWYYMDGPFCLISEYSYNIPDKNGNHYFGFDASGAVLSGWIAVPKVSKSGSNVAGPNGSSETKTTDYVWTYYGKGCEQQQSGWLNVNGDWFYMVEDKDTANGNADAGYIALTNTYLEDTTGDKNYYYYFDDKGYLVRNDSLTFTAGDKAKTINVLSRNSANPTEPVTATAITIAAKDSVTLSFNENGALLTGIVNNMYYEDGVASTKLYTVTVEVKDGNINVYAMEMNKGTRGKLYTGNYIMVDKDGVVRYFDNGVMVKSDAIVFGNKILAFDKDGKLVGATAVEIGEVKYMSSLNYDTNSDETVVETKPELMQFATKVDGNIVIDGVVDGVYYSSVVK